MSKALAAWVVVGLVLAGCSESEFDVSQQYGSDPVLPEPESNLIPDLKVAEVVGWPKGQVPAVAEGLVATVYATDLVIPRTVHTLPNGDVIVVQSKAPPGKPLNRPKDIIRGFIISMAAGGGGGEPPKETNLITLLRDTNRDGQVDERSDLLTGLTSPFGSPGMTARCMSPLRTQYSPIPDHGRKLVPGWLLGRRDLEFRLQECEASVDAVQHRVGAVAHHEPPTAAAPHHALTHSPTLPPAAVTLLRRSSYGEGPRKRGCED